MEWPKTWQFQRGSGENRQGFPDGKQPKGLTTARPLKETARGHDTPMELGLGLGDVDNGASRSHPEHLHIGRGRWMEEKQTGVTALAVLVAATCCEGLLPKGRGHALGKLETTKGWLVALAPAADGSQRRQIGFRISISESDGTCRPQGVVSAALFEGDSCRLKLHRQTERQKAFISSGGTASNHAHRWGQRPSCGRRPKLHLSMGASVAAVNDHRQIQLGLARSSCGRIMAIRWSRFEAFEQIQPSSPIATTLGSARSPAASGWRTWLQCWDYNLPNGNASLPEKTIGQGTDRRNFARLPRRSGAAGHHTSFPPALETSARSARSCEHDVASALIGFQTRRKHLKEGLDDWNRAGWWPAMSVVAGRRMERLQALCVGFLDRPACDGTEARLCGSRRCCGASRPRLTALVDLAEGCVHQRLCAKHAGSFIRLLVVGRYRR